LIAGRPVISYDVDGAREVTITGQTGILVPPQDTAALADALATLAGNAELRARLGSAGQQRFTEQFRHQRMTRLVRDVYQQVLEQSRLKP
jgi:glycosyltransferase involved in cell wall biosynthesis